MQTGQPGGAPTPESSNKTSNETSEMLKIRGQILGAESDLRYMNLRRENTKPEVILETEKRLEELKNQLDHDSLTSGVMYTGNLHYLSGMSFTPEQINFLEDNQELFNKIEEIKLYGEGKFEKLTDLQKITFLRDQLKGREQFEQFELLFPEKDLVDLTGAIKKAEEEVLHTTGRRKLYAMEVLIRLYNDLEHQTAIQRNLILRERDEILARDINSH